MAASTFKTLTDEDIVSTRTLLHEAIPLTGTIVSGTYSDNNIKFHTHGMFQTVYDYPYLSSSANHIFDITYGLSTRSSVYDTNVNQYKKKKNIYNQMAQVLVGYDVTGSVLEFDADGNILAGGAKLRWTGTGGNGKSKLVELMSMTIGDYFSNLSVALLTQKRKASGAASPELEKTKGKRLVVMQEPDVNETINVGEMKELTGNDKIEARALFKEPIEFTPQYKMLMMCNDLPEVPSNDDGTWRRIEGVPFDSKFVENKNEVNPELHIYPRDKKLKGKFPFWTLPLMIKLLQEWREYDKYGIIIPEEVKNKTKSFRNENDVVGMWIDQCCEIAENVRVSDLEKYAPTEFDILYLEFSEWAETKEYKKPSRPKVMEAFNKWQAKSRFGLSLGKKKSDKCVNGTEQEPLYNLVVS